MIFGLIKSVLKSLELYLAFKNKAFHRDLVNDHRDRERELINEIENLRSSGISNDALRADLLRDQLLKEKEQFKYLTDLYSSQNDNGASKKHHQPSHNEDK